MTLNPITALSEQLQKLINERGSAAILRDHLALFKDQVVALEKENLRLLNETGIYKVNEEKFKSDIEHLKKENEVLREEIKEYERPHDILQHDESVRILTYLAKIFEPSTAAIANALKIEKETANFYLHELESSKMVIQNPRIDDYGELFEVWSLEQEGRRFLVQNKMLT